MERLEIMILAGLASVLVLSPLWWALGGLF